MDYYCNFVCFKSNYELVNEKYFIPTVFLQDEVIASI